MTLSGQKTAILYDFYRENGFSNSIDTIAATLNISKKTFFNRYGSKYNSIVMAFGHWFSILEGRWLEIQGHCNNAVEELVMFMYATKKTMVEERHYYDLILKERCFLKNKEQAIRLEAYPVRAAESTGCGDHFAAGFVSGIMSGKAPEEALRFANACGAVCATGIGAATALQSREQVLEWIRKH